MQELPGTYHAWLSDNNGTGISSAAARIGGAESDVSYRMRNGGIVAASWTDLVESGPNKAIVFTEQGETLDVIPSRVWTNTADTGYSLGAMDCAGWTANNFEFGSLGLTQKSEKWSDAGVQQIYSDEYHLYCFQGEGVEMGLCTKRWKSVTAKPIAGPSV